MQSALRKIAVPVDTIPFRWGQNAFTMKVFDVLLLNYVSLWQIINHNAINTCRITAKRKSNASSHHTRQNTNRHKCLLFSCPHTRNCSRFIYIAIGNSMLFPYDHHLLMYISFGKTMQRHHMCVCACASASASDRAHGFCPWIYPLSSFSHTHNETNLRLRIIKRADIRIIVVWILSICITQGYVDICIYCYRCAPFAFVHQWKICVVFIRMKITVVTSYKMQRLILIDYSSAFLCEIFLSYTIIYMLYRYVHTNKPVHTYHQQYTRTYWIVYHCCSDHFIQCSSLVLNNNYREYFR